MAKRELGLLVPDTEFEQSLPQDERHVVRLSTFQKDVADQVLIELAKDNTIYKRGGWLVQIVSGHDSITGLKANPKPQIRPLALATLQERISHSIRFELFVESGQDGKGAVYKTVHPPGWCVRAIHARGEWPCIRALSGIADYPLWLHDGKILTGNGYDNESGVFLNYNGPRIEVPARVSPKSARLAAQTILDLTSDFPFESESHRVAWLTALMTPVCRFAIDGPVPFFLCDANVPAAGKGKLMNLVSLVLSGRNFSVAPYPAEKSEWAKTITAYALSGYPWIFFDNLTSQLGDANLDAVLTNPHWESRMLGGNSIISEPLNVVFFATGNNVQLIGDIGRRTCHIRLSSKEEHPEDRTGFHHPDLEAEALARRGELLACVLSVLRAYHQAGRPKVELLPWGSFETWSTAVRAPLVWLGLPDPGMTFRNLQSQADHEAKTIASLAYFFSRVQCARASISCREFLSSIKNRSPELMSEEDFDNASDLLASLLKDVNSVSLGKLLHKFRYRLFDGRRFVTRGTSRGITLWSVETKEQISPAGE